MSKAFLREAEAWEYIKTVADPVQSLLLEIGLANALSFLVTDDDYRRVAPTAPLDLLVFVRALGAVLSQTAVIEGVLSRRITNIAQLSPFPDVE